MRLGIESGWRSDRKGGAQVAAGLLAVWTLAGWSTSCPAQKTTDDKAAAVSVTKPEACRKPIDVSKIPSPTAMAGPYGSHMPVILATIGASADQQQKIMIVVTNFKPMIAPLRETYTVKSKVYLNKVIVGAPTEEIIEMQTELCQLHQEICAQYCKMSLDVRRLLLPQQVKLYEEYRAKQGWTK